MSHCTRSSNFLSPRLSLVTLMIALIALPSAIRAEPPTPDKAIWRGPCYNCYNYATNRKTVFFAQPPVVGPLTCASVAAAARANGLLDGTNGAGAGFWHGPQDGAPPAGWPAGQCPPGHCLVALVVDPDPNGDFHWYRLNGDGSWSHKPGQTPATCRDAAGVLMGAANPPHTAALGRYMFCQYMCVPAPPAVLPGFAGIGAWTVEEILLAWRLRENGIEDLKRDLKDALETLEHLPSGLPVPDPAWDELPQSEFKGFSLLSAPTAPPQFPPYLRVYNGVVAYYSNLEGDQNTVIQYFADDRGLEQHLSQLFAGQPVPAITPWGSIAVAASLLIGGMIVAQRTTRRRVV